MNEAQLMLERSMRSVFVGNIPFDLTEERLKEIFSEVGPVLSFKLVYDRENGKPKGYGFCEYKDVETANSAMRNLNGYEVGGRALKVDNAANEKSRMEMQNSLNDPSEDAFEHIAPEKVPEAISKAVASLPPEQMFELMKQMKDCIKNNPNEARTMLLQNPQLAYGLLQSMVVMRIVDPETALTMLHKPHNVTDLTDPRSVPPPTIRPEYAPNNSIPEPPIDPRSRMVPHNAPPIHQMQPNMMSQGDTDLRQMPMPVPAPGPPPEQIVRDPRQAPMMNSGPPRDMRPIDPRSGVPSIRSAPMMQPQRMPPTNNQPQQMSSLQQQQMAAGMASMANMGSAVSDQEKAALIMQVLQLTDEQIAMLPPEQRQSILLLKEQIAKSSQR